MFKLQSDYQWILQKVFFLTFFLIVIKWFYSFIVVSFIKIKPNVKLIIRTAYCQIAAITQGKERGFSTDGPWNTYYCTSALSFIIKTHTFWALTGWLTKNLKLLTKESTTKGSPFKWSEWTVDVMKHRNAALANQARRTANQEPSWNGCTSWFQAEWLEPGLDGGKIEERTLYR